MKRFLPLISLIFVSIVVSMCALGVIYVLSVDAIAGLLVIYLGAGVSASHAGWRADVAASDIGIPLHP